MLHKRAHLVLNVHTEAMVVNMLTTAQQDIWMRKVTAIRGFSSRAAICLSCICLEPHAGCMQGLYMLRRLQ